jgi:peroxiredoxin/predicted 2-oxoglutarate/Fe(II)-dependent dioxygenase YbiX
MVSLTVGDPVPWFTLPSTSSSAFHFNTVGGYFVVLFFFGSSSRRNSAFILQEFCEQQDRFSDFLIPFFGISADPNDTALAELVKQPTFFKLMWDFEGTVSRQYGVLDSQKDTTVYQPTTFVLDPTLRVLRVFPVENPEEHVNQVMTFLESLPAPEPHRMADRQAPVLLIPRVFDPEFCRYLIHLFDADGGKDSGFMREVEGKTVEVTDYGFKKRRDLNLAEGDPALLEKVNNFVIGRVKPEIEKVFQFGINRFERHIVACYEAKNHGFFNRHRDNTTKGTAHRRFAMTINLNTGDYEGGCLWFPEYGRQLYRPDVGEAVIFSCSLLHEATPVTNGRRFALLSFFYADEDAKLRERNLKYLATHKSDDDSNENPDVDRTPSFSKTTSGFQPKSTRSKTKGFQTKKKT